MVIDNFIWRSMDSMKQINKTVNELFLITTLMSLLSLLPLP